MRVQWAMGLALAMQIGACAQSIPAAPPCPADLVLSGAAPARGIPVEATPGGHCLAARAAAGDRAAALRLGDFYTALPGTLPLIDRNGRMVHWYRLAGDNGSPQGAWRAAQLIDLDRDRQVPNDALSYLLVAVKAQIPEAGDYLLDQWQDGRVDPGKLWSFRRWLAHPGVLPEDQRQAIMTGLDTPPTDPLAPE